MDVRNSARLALAAWQSEVGRLAMQGPRSFNAAYPAPPRALTPDDCSALGFELNGEHSAYNFLDGAGKSMVRIDFSPSLQHQAVLVQGPPQEWWGALMWVDGEFVPVPRESDGNPLCEKYAEWLDERFVYARTGGVWDHPLLDPSAIDNLGSLRGVLIWDASQHHRYLEQPEPQQRWTSPLVGVRDNSLCIYPNGAAFRENRPDRVLPYASA